MKKLIFALACLLCAANGFAQEKTPKAEESVYTVVQQRPEYPGGQTEFVKFIRENFQYPELPEALGIQGRVVVRFVVRKDGNVAAAQIVKGAGYGLDEEALRIVEKMPKWTPGIQNDNPVNVFFSLPITFKLEKGINDMSRTLYIDEVAVGTIQENEALIHKLALENKPFKLKEDAKTVHVTFTK